MRDRERGRERERQRRVVLRPPILRPLPRADAANFLFLADLILPLPLSPFRVGRAGGLDMLAQRQGPREKFAKSDEDGDDDKSAHVGAFR